MRLTELAEMFHVRPGAKIATLKTRTQPKLKGGKKSPLAGKLVEKETEVNGVLNWIYENAVNKQREKEGIEPDFQAEPRAWGQRVRLNKKLTPFVKHIKDNEKRIYLEIKFQNSNGRQYYIDGNPVADSEVEPHLVPEGPSRQGVENRIILRDYRVANIQQIRIAGEEHDFEYDAEEESNLYDIFAE